MTAATIIKSEKKLEGLYTRRTTLNKQIRDQVRSLENEMRDKVRNLESKYKKKIQGIENSTEREEIEKSIDETKLEKEKQDRRFSLSVVKNYLGEPWIETRHDMFKDTSKILDETDCNLFEIRAHITENRKPTNRYTYTIELFVKNYKLYDILNFHHWRNCIIKTKDFKTIKECEAYHKRNYNRLIMDTVNRDNDLWKEANELNIDPADDFDFRFINSEYLYEKDDKPIKTKTTLKFEKDGYSFKGDVSDEVKFQVTYTGKNNFKVSCDNKKVSKKEIIKTVTQILTNSLPLWVENPGIKIVQWPG